jgi:hypothetical protein
MFYFMNLDAHARSSPDDTLNVLSRPRNGPPGTSAFGHAEHDGNNRQDEAKAKRYPQQCGKTIAKDRHHDHYDPPIERVADADGTKGDGDHKYRAPAQPVFARAAHGLISARGTEFFGHHLAIALRTG